MKETETYYLLDRALSNTDLPDTFQNDLRECIWVAYNCAMQGALWQKYGGRDHIVSILVLAHRYFHSAEVVVVFEDGKKGNRVLENIISGLEYDEAMIDIIFTHESESRGCITGDEVAAAGRTAKDKYKF